MSIQFPTFVQARTPLAASAPVSASVGVTSAQVLPANVGRGGLVLINTSTNVISVAFGANAAVLNAGITLEASGGTFVMDGNMFSNEAVNAIASGGGSNLALQEFVAI